MKKLFSCLLLLWAGMTVAPAQGSTEEFPHRGTYKDVTVIETADLYAKMDSYTIVDVRSHYEYETLRVTGAVNIPLSNDTFKEEIAKLWQQTKKPMVFYCNGLTCTKSYDAARAARQAAPEGRYFAYDRGAMTWAKSHPDKAILLGQSPVNVHKLLDESAFKSRLLEPKAFEAKIGNSALILDIRDRIQRDSFVFFLQEIRASLDEKAKLDAVIERAKREKKTLLIYDKTGQQVKWFQYYLEKVDLKDYYFMKGGEYNYYKVTLNLKL
jgi:rhodanese-related sulfurtransferase